MIKIKNANFVCTMKHVKLQNFDPEQIEFLVRVSEQIGFFYIIYTPVVRISFKGHENCQGLKLKVPKNSLSVK